MPKQQLVQLSEGDAWKLQALNAQRQLRFREIEDMDREIAATLGRYDIPPAELGAFLCGQSRTCRRSP